MVYLPHESLKMVEIHSSWNIPQHFCSEKAAMKKTHASNFHGNSTFFGSQEVPQAMTPSCINKTYPLLEEEAVEYCSYSQESRTPG